MTLPPNAQPAGAVREALQDRAAQVARLEAMCAAALRDPPPLQVAQDSRTLLLLRLLCTSLERYREALRREGAVVPPVPAAAPADLGGIAQHCAELRDQTWAAWRVVMDGAAGSARFLEGQALELEFILRALDYVQHSPQPEAQSGWLGRNFSSH